MENSASGSVSYTHTASAPPEGGIARSVHSLQVAIGGIESTVDSLIDRLQDACLPTQPPGPSEVPEDVAASCPMAERVDTQTRRLGDVGARLQTLLASIDL